MAGTVALSSSVNLAIDPTIETARGARRPIDTLGFQLDQAVTRKGDIQIFERPASNRSLMRDRQLAE